jgi:hypothetical protein
VRGLVASEAVAQALLVIAQPVSEIALARLRLAVAVAVGLGWLAIPS